ncbi:MAG: phage tail tape measure C-terminal domain-containing protein, partial [bacterium]
IQFSDEQITMVKRMTEVGDVAGAQKLILSELERQYGGQAEAAAKAGKGATQQLSNYLGDLKEGAGKVIINILNKISNWLMKVIPTAIEKTRAFIKRAKDGIIDFVNSWIELYNKSVAFRIAIEYIKFGFKTTFGYVKMLLKNFINSITTVGKILVYTFNPKNWGKNFGEGLKSLVSEGFGDIKDNVKDFGEDVKEDFLEGIENVKNGEMKLITEDDEKEVLKQAEQLGKQVKEIVNNGGQPVREKITLEKVDSISAKGVDNPEAEKIKEAGIELEKNNTELEKQKTLWGDLGTQISETLKGEAVSALNGIGDALTTVFEGGKASLKGFITSMLDGIRKVINALLVEAIAGMIAGEAKKGLLGIATAAVGVTLLTSLWKSKVPEFERGGTMQNSGLAVVGEAGKELVSLPRGARVHSAGRSRQMMNSAGNNNINISGKLVAHGSDLYYVFNEYQRKRNTVI